MNNIIRITKEDRMTWPNSAIAAIATPSGSSVSMPEGAAGAPESALKGGGWRSALALYLVLLLLSSAFGGVINKCCAVNMGFISKGLKFCRTQQYSVTAGYPSGNRGRVPRHSVTQSATGLFVVLPSV